MPKKTAVATPSTECLPVPPGHAWATVLRPLGKLVRSLGGDPEAVFRAARVEATHLGAANSYLPIAVRGELIARASMETGCEHFGLLLGSHSGVAEIGILGEVMPSRPAVRQALEALETYWCLHTPTVAVFVRRPTCPGEAHAAFCYTVLDGNLPGMAQVHDGAMAVTLNIMRGLLGADWCPTAVRLMRREPRDPALYASFFGQPAVSMRLIPSCFSREDTGFADSLFPGRPGRPALHSEQMLRDALGARLEGEGWAEHVTASSIASCFRGRAVS